MEISLRIDSAPKGSSTEGFRFEIGWRLALKSVVQVRLELYGVISRVTLLAPVARYLTNVKVCARRGEQARLQGLSRKMLCKDVDELSVVGEQGVYTSAIEIDEESWSRARVGILSIGLRMIILLTRFRSMGKKSAVILGGRVEVILRGKCHMGAILVN